MMSFGERMGINLRQEMQVEGLDERTRNLLYNVLIRNTPLEPVLDWAGNSTGRGSIPPFLSEEVAEFLGEQLKRDHVYNETTIEKICNAYDWDKVYGFIELIYPHSRSREQFIEKINKIMIAEKCTYRMGGDGLFLRVSSEEEFQSLEQSLSLGQGSVKGHLQKAVGGYSQRGENNYDEVCNEAIKAVEALARQFLDSKYESKTLGQCLEPLRQKLALPPFVIEPIKKIWEISNDGNFATRHAQPKDGQSAIGEPEAYYILITCSSFINYVYKVGVK